MKSLEFINKAKDIATNYKTLYILGCFGSPMTETNKHRYTNNNSYNKSPERASKINAASRDTFGFDCVCLIKGILWGWNGDINKTYGGAVYKSNGVPDVSATTMLNEHCTDISSDFSNVTPGELVWKPGHIGIYIGDGLAVECTPIWKDGVQITAVKNMGVKDGYNNRTWEKHGKCVFIDYTDQDKPVEPEKTIDELAQEVIEGKWGNNPERKEALIAAGYDYEAVQKRVNEILASEKDNEEIKLGDLVIVNGVGRSSSDGTGYYTAKYENRTMKVIAINKGAKNPYALNKYAKGNIKDYSQVTAWFRAEDVKKA